MSIYDNVDLLPLDLQGWNGTANIFVDLISELRPNIIVEVGTWKGQSAITMGNSIQKLELSSKIYCIDTWLGAIEFLTELKDTPERNLLLKNGYPQIYYQFLSNVIHTGLTDIIIPIPNTSYIGYRYLLYHNIIPDLVYIDASHEEFDVYQDLQNYYSILSPNGVIFGDDFLSWKGVSSAVIKFCSDMNIEYNIIEHNFWVIRK